MRSVILATIVLLPALAQAQISGTQLQTGSAVDAPVTLQAKLVQPAVFGHTAKATPAAASAPVAPMHDDVQFRLDSDPAATADLNSGSVTARFGSSEPEATAPKLVHIVGRTLPLQRLISEENSAHVAVSLTVDDEGKPSHLTVVRSAGAELDEQTLAAVRQYRFFPATVDHSPVKSQVTVDVVLKK